MTGNLTRREENTEIHTEKHRKESQVDRDEIRVIQIQAKKY